MVDLFSMQLDVTGCTTLHERWWTGTILTRKSASPQHVLGDLLLRRHVESLGIAIGEVWFCL